MKQSAYNHRYIPNTAFVYRNDAITPRPLRINLDDYTQGDVQFREELTTLLIMSVVELKQGLYMAMLNEQPDMFIRACHKAKTTLSIIEDDEFTFLATLIEEEIVVPMKSVSFWERVVLFNHLSDAVIAGLKAA